MTQDYRSIHRSRGTMTTFAMIAAAALMSGIATTGAHAQALGYASSDYAQPFANGLGASDQDVDRSPAATIDDAVANPESALPERLRRAVVPYNTSETPGTVIVDTGNTTLYYVLGHGRAIRYGIGVGREGFTWSGVKPISRKAEWPDWRPPAEMIARQPYLPRFMAGGPGNPLGARALYLGSSEYRIHGTNDPSTIGKFVSSGCIRLTNADIEDLFNRVKVGTKVVVLPKRPHLEARSSEPRALPRDSHLRVEHQALNLSPPRVN